MTHVVVAVPAHNEEDRIGECLTSVLRALQQATAGGHVSRACVAIAAHRCTDETLVSVNRLLCDWTANLPHPARSPSYVLREDWDSTTVGRVRHTLVQRVLDTGWVTSPERTWLLSTDADSTVPPDWVSACLTQACATRSAAMAGLVELVDWYASCPAREEYDRIIAAGMQPDGHTHVYAANLAVRLDAYLAVGGFPSVPHGEERVLRDRLLAAGWPVHTSLAPAVRTSGRMPGRAEHGLGALLSRLEREDSRSRDHAAAAGPQVRPSPEPKAGVRGFFRVNPQGLLGGLGGKIRL